MLFLCVFLNMEKAQIHIYTFAKTYRELMKNEIYF